ncbi:hypothetical protein DXU06_35740 [Bradyrhizobium elkanii]
MKKPASCVASPGSHSGSVRNMTKSEQQSDVKQLTPSRVEEAQRVISEYMSDLREIIWKLHRKMN